ncbi:MAG: hypothetical protein OWV35_13300, partial [Firmicutes bacterium]|nr:hypothetical protein [Bacillota bacterium]
MTTLWAGAYALGAALEGWWDARQGELPYAGSALLMLIGWWGTGHPLGPALLGRLGWTVLLLAPLVPAWWRERLGAGDLA